MLNLVLSVEYVESAFYQEALARAGLQGDLKNFARIVVEHEKAHVAFLKQALAVATYNGQAVNLTPASLKAAARIVSVEGRHAAWIRSIVGDVPAEAPMDAAVNEGETRAQLRDFGVQAG